MLSIAFETKNAVEKWKCLQMVNNRTTASQVWGNDHNTLGMRTILRISNPVLRQKNKVDRNENTNEEQKQKKDPPLKQINHT